MGWVYFYPRRCRGLLARSPTWLLIYPALLGATRQKHLTRFIMDRPRGASCVGNWRAMAGSSFAERIGAANSEGTQGVLAQPIAEPLKENGDGLKNLMTLLDMTD